MVVFHVGDLLSLYKINPINPRQYLYNIIIYSYKSYNIYILSYNILFILSLYNIKRWFFEQQPSDAGFALASLWSGGRMVAVGRPA